MIIISCDLYALALRKGKISNFFENKILIYLRNISMYIFLTHYLIRIYIDYFVTYFNLQSLKIATFEILCTNTTKKILILSHFDELQLR